MTILEIITRAQLEALNANGYSIVQTSLLEEVVGYANSLATAQEDALDEDHAIQNEQTLMKLCLDHNINLTLEDDNPDEAEIILTHPDGKELRIPFGSQFTDETLAKAREMFTP